MDSIIIIIVSSFNTHFMFFFYSDYITVCHQKGHRLCRWTKLRKETTKLGKGPPSLLVRIGVVQNQVGPAMKYLWLNLDSRWSFKAHFDR